MITDALVSFVGLNAGPLSLVAGGGDPIASGIIDLLGNGVGQAPTNIIGNAAVFGTDEGVGGKRPELNITIGTTLTAAAGTTLKVALQAAVENEFGQKVKKRWAVNIPKDGSDLQAEFRDSDELYEQDLRMFRACFELYKWTRANDPFAAGNPVEPIGSLEPAQRENSLASDCPF